MRTWLALFGYMESRLAKITHDLSSSLAALEVLKMQLKSGDILKLPEADASDFLLLLNLSLEKLRQILTELRALSKNTLFVCF